MEDIDESMRIAIEGSLEAEFKLFASYNMAADFLAGRLREMCVSVDFLRDLKTELKNFDAKQGKWKQ